MADLVANKQTSLSIEDVITRAVQFFSTRQWQATSQSARAVTFKGKPSIPWFMILLTIVGFMFCIIPGIIMYVMVIRKMYRFVNLVVTANPLPKGTEVTITHPKNAAKMASRFLYALPPISSAA